MSEALPLVDYLAEELSLSARIDLARRLIAVCATTDQAFTPYQVSVDPESGAVQLELGKILGVKDEPLPYLPSMTQAYLPVELLARERSVLDERSRVYIAGVYGYIALAGSHPLGWLTDLILVHQVALRDPTPLTRFDPEMPSSVEQLILAMLAKDPDDRPDSLAKVSEAFEKIAALKDVQSAEVDLSELLPPARRETAAGTRAGFAVAAVSLAVVFGAFQYVRHTQPAEIASAPVLGSTAQARTVVAAGARRDLVADALRLAENLEAQAEATGRPVAEEPQAALSAALLRSQAAQALEAVAPEHPKIPSLVLEVERTADEFIAEARRVGGERAETYLEMVLQLSPDHPIALQDLEKLSSDREAEVASVAADQTQRRAEASARSKRARRALAAANVRASKGPLFDPSESSDAYRSYAEVLRLYSDLGDVRRGAERGVGEVVGQLRGDVQAFMSERRYVEAERVVGQLNVIAAAHPAAISPKDRWLAETMTFLAAATDPERVTAERAQRDRDIANWLDLAARRMEDGKFILPAEDSAAWFLRRVLSADPNHAGAKKRLETVIEGPQIAEARRKLRGGGPDDVREAQAMIVALTDHFPENTELGALAEQAADRAEQLARLGRLELAVKGYDGDVLFPEVFVNDKAYGIREGARGLSVLELEPARYRVRLEAMYHNPWEEWVDLSAGNVTRIEPHMEGWQ